MKRFTVPLFKTQLLVTQDMEESARFLNKLDGEDYTEWFMTCAGSVHDIEDGRFLVYIGQARPGVVAHEAVHAAIAVLDHAGVPISKKNQEVLAYLTEWITDKVDGVVNGKHN